MLEFKSVKINKPEAINLILGQSHFIKSVEDIFEVMVNNVAGVKFGLAFVESSGACKVRIEGTDEELKKMAGENALNLGCGHSFVILMRDSYPINVLNALKFVPEVCNIFCATANSVEVVIAESESGRGIMGVIDGAKPKGLENNEDIAWRKDILRKFSYKL
jgi:uncharacterized protein